MGKLLNLTVQFVRILKHKTLRTLNLLLKRLVESHWSIHKVYHKQKLKRSATPSTLVVYSMGKVGSSAVFHALANSQNSYKCFHVHWLTKKNLQFDEKFYFHQEKKYKNTQMARKFRPTYIWDGEYLQNRLEKFHNEPRKWKVITLTRDPVARNISSFFQNLELFFGYNIKQNMYLSENDRVMDELHQLFHDGYIRDSAAVRADANPLTWFADELNNAFEIDIFSRPFPVEKGFEIYDSAKADILIMRVEDLGSCFEPALKKFTGLSDIQLASKNTASEKPYAALYRKFVETIELPGHYLDKLYDSKYSRHFYSHDEISRFRQNWEVPGKNHVVSQLE